MATFSPSTSSKRRKGQEEDSEERSKCTKYASNEPKKTILTAEIFVPMINSGNVPEATRAFQQGRNPYKLIKTCLEKGLCNQDKIKQFLKGLAEILGSDLQDQVKTVWLGVRKGFPHDPVFVLIPYYTKTILSKKDLPIPFRYFECVFRQEYDVNDESRKITYDKKLRRIIISNEDRAAVDKTVKDNLTQLYQCHTNIEGIRRSAVRSIKYGQQNARLIKETCIVIYVHVKGIIPFGEKEFPPQIGNFPVDVREGKLYPYKDISSDINSIQWFMICNKIMQTLMSLRGMEAKLRDLPDDGVATLTCAKMMWCEGTIIHQPKLFFREDNPSEMGLDNEVVETKNESRLPATETFQEDDAHDVSGIRLPPEILRMDEHSQQLYREALQAGKRKVFNFRLMIVGHQGVGKTTLAKRILGENVADISHDKTEGIEIHYRCCKINLATEVWSPEKADNRFSDSDQELVAIIHDHVNKETRSNTLQEKKLPNLGTFQISNKPNQNKEITELHKTDTTNYLASSSNLLRDENVDVIYERKPAVDPEKPPIDHIQSFEDGIDCVSTDRTINTDRADESYFHKFVTRNRARTYSETAYSYVTMLDFAGESVYYSTHQTFMSWRTLYLLVTDASKSLNDSVAGDVCSIDFSGGKKCSIQDYAVYWMNSIFSHGIPNLQRERRSPQQVGNDANKHEAEQYPTVIMVATHMDKVPEDMRNRKKEEYFESVGRLVKDRPLRFLLKGYFAISNFGSDADIDELKNKIFELAQKQTFWGEEIPGSWLALEQKLIDLKEAGTKVIEYTVVEKLSLSSVVKIEKTEELELFLRYEHDLGHIMFFNTEKLRNKIILDPDWLIRGLSLLMLSSTCVMEKHPEIMSQWYDFKDTGRLTESLTVCLWSEDNECYQHQAHLLDVMEHLSIITQPAEKGDIVQNQEKYYWVPCMIQKIAPDHIKNLELSKDIIKTSTLCFVSKTKFVHKGVFDRLIASLLRKWPAAKEGNEFQLFIGCCKFEVDDCHTLVVSLTDFVINATVFLYSPEATDLDINLCVDIRECIYSTLSDITACISPNSEFDVYVKCDRGSQLSTEGLLEISDERNRRCNCTQPAHTVNLEKLLKFWKKQDVRSVTQSKTSDRDRFNRLSCLLVDIGGKVLRRLLLFFTVRPHCSFDQFLRNNRQKIDNLKQNKILTKVQFDSVFPQNGTTDLNKYDISLTSALLINLIPNLNHQTEQKIKDVREDRNKYQAHACSARMSSSDFNVHWPRITANITDLCKCCNDPIFEKDIREEIQTILQSDLQDIKARLNKCEEIIQILHSRENITNEQV